MITTLEGDKGIEPTQSPLHVTKTKEPAYD